LTVAFSLATGATTFVVFAPATVPTTSAVVRTLRVGKLPARYASFG